MESTFIAAVIFCFTFIYRNGNRVQAIDVSA